MKETNNICMFCDFTTAKSKKITRIIKKLTKKIKYPIKKIGICLLKLEEKEKIIAICSGMKPYPKYCPLLNNPIKSTDFNKYDNLTKLYLTKR